MRLIGIVYTMLLGDKINCNVIDNDKIKKRWKPYD